ncbi:A/G-specific adenine glycosylase [bacterium]|nr:A/G-specific adenine glycosylase [bacterium]
MRHDELTTEMTCGDAPQGRLCVVLREALLAWFHEVKREMPWRRTRDPYAIWVSEIMLQQTRVATVLPYYDAFLRRFPSVRELAEAPEEEVLRLWAGLGYYSRARNLHAAARQILQEHAGQFPATWQQVRALPGIGDYTAGAILSLAFGQPVPCIDGNAERVLCRLFGIEEAPKRNPARTRIREVATALVTCDTPGDVNQALMEMGSTLCTPRSPGCEACPVSNWCRARAEGRQAQLPQLPSREKTVRVRSAAVLVRSTEGVLLAQRSTGGVWAGLWEFPQVEVSQGRSRAALAAHLQESLELRITVGRRALQIAHGIMNRTITLEVFEATAEGTDLRVRGYAQARWVRAEDFGDYAFSAPHRRIADWVKEAGVA